MAALAPLVGEYSPRRHHTLILALIFSAGPLGPVIGGLIAAPLIAEQGWQSIFLYAGSITVGIGILLYTMVPESMAFIIKRRPDCALDRVNRILSYIGQLPVERLPPLDTSAPHESAPVVSLLIPARRVPTLLLWGTFFLAFATVYFFTSWLPQMLVSVGFPQDQALRGAVTVALGSVIGTALFGALSKRWPLNRIVAFAFAIGGFAAALLGVLLMNLPLVSARLIWLTLLLVGITIMGGFINLYSIALLLYPAQVRSTGMGWAAGLGRGGAVISPAVAGFLMGAGLSAPLLSVCFALPILLAAVGALWLRMRELP